MEAVWRLTGREDEPLMTRFVANQLATAHWYRTENIERDLGYRPAVSMEQGMERLAAAWAERYGPEVAARFRAEGVDCVLLTPA